MPSETSEGNDIASSWQWLFVPQDPKSACGSRIVANFNSLLECNLTFSPPDNGGWMQATVQVQVPAFGGTFTCTVEKQEWDRFIEALQYPQSSVGKDAGVSWGNMEQNIEFGLKLHVRGTLEVKYRFSADNFSIGPTLSGSFEADQSFLQSWLKSAKEVRENAR